MACLPRVGAAILALILLASSSASVSAGSPYPGWRGHYGTPYTAYRAGGPLDDDRRALDGSYRTPPLLLGTWTGLYAGAHLGAGLGSVETSELAAANIDLDSFLGGAQAGYNYQFGNFIAGLELDATFSTAESDATSAAGLEISAGSDWISSARVRLGYASDRFMVYATGGVALGDLDLNVTGPGASASMSETLVGYAVGGGVEMMLTDSWIARVEAIHYGFGDQSFDTPFGDINADADVTTVRAGLSLKLN